ncbi:MAG: CDP-diacylglycerol--glycerol-3-phosphate 3-phosphatidyltransferase [Elusimicrobia bacterium RIFCSPLOWO2_02_FULL_39_32]|nr:MAG: CDP-diacylglycerol--glycerol-3-phosphate 3-phosphatidyltransferase [Elusimicrobia bacterium RIFCSPHIGHO2_02_FULL_39_36]OGR92028.1 MAG: CDP-diacylglycerol--glycerol-3-phosphate 3-phosphatidyltransferase [Elusimicrobia bacterium RIFCSPLOWO2_02_FULL_39_32]OGR98681.1 MAG: CDP-diacylglycerol--glycerol-3-phosphate 3-phosphatidyltransferase [Elusimicrobia bacterium RIFCSPLOWO2_12_FULL_39_28]OGZ59777.1 MAG: CDP-diacylglycerol--glycerol-3-phosphate 3-phosphatidyltransferase [Candidatus Spechtbact
MNLANKLTVLRLGLVPIFMIFTVIDNVWTRIFALVIFIAAALTDLYDGYFARKYGVITDFGKFFDPLADKFLISAAFISFVGLRELNVPAWMVVFIIGREFLITGLRTLAASKGVIIAADRAGKFKTSSQITAIILILIILCVNSILTHFYRIHPLELLEGSNWQIGFGNFLVWASYWIVFIATLLTLISGLSYLYKNRAIFLGDLGVKL